MWEEEKREDTYFEGGKEADKNITEFGEIPKSNKKKKEKSSKDIEAEGGE